MSEALFSLGLEGKRVLERFGVEEIVLERKPPKQLEHLVGVNDLRIAAELVGSLSYFFACWELPGLGWRYPVIPDAVFSLRNRTFAVEFDRGAEGIRYFIRSKLSAYQRGFAGFPIAAVLVVADRKPRIEALARAIGDRHGQVLFTTIELVRERGILAPVFYRNSAGDGVPLV